MSGNRKSQREDDPLFSDKNIAQVARGVEAVSQRTMQAWIIERDNHGRPDTAFRQATVDIPDCGDDDVIVQVKAAGVNYNGVWAALGEPVSVFDFVEEDFFIAGSDMSGVVWKVGKNVTRYKVGDEVIAHCSQIDFSDPECLGGDPMLSKSQKIWGYESNYGAFAQLARVQKTQLLKKPAHLTWEESAGYLLCLATAYRMLFGHAPHILKPDSAVLIWGAAGGLGSYALQLCNLVGAKAIAVVSSDQRADYVKTLGAHAIIRRDNYECLQSQCAPMTDGYEDWIKSCSKFKRDIATLSGKRAGVDIVFEHPGRVTFPVSAYCAAPGGMIVFCAATTGFDLNFDARYVWMRQKRIQGSHFANYKECAAVNEFVADRRISPCISDIFNWEDLPMAHQRMFENVHLPGGMVIRVG